jgi:hypothetical protein
MDIGMDIGMSVGISVAPENTGQRSKIKSLETDLLIFKIDNSHLGE